MWTSLNKDDKQLTLAVAGKYTTCPTSAQHLHLIAISLNNRTEWQQGKPITLALAGTKTSQSEGEISVGGGTSSRDRLLTLCVPSNLIKQKVQLDVGRDVSLDSRDNSTHLFWLFLILFYAQKWYLEYISVTSCAPIYNHSPSMKHNF